GDAADSTVLQNQIGHPLGDRLDQVPAFGGHSLVDPLGQKAVVDSVGEVVAHPGSGQVDVELDIDREELALGLLVIENAVMGEHLEPLHGDAVCHPPAGGTSARPSGPSGRPRISWTTAMANTESSSSPAWSRKPASTPPRASSTISRWMRARDWGDESASSMAAWMGAQSSRSISPWIGTGNAASPASV